MTTNPYCFSLRHNLFTLSLSVLHCICWDMDLMNLIHILVKALWYSVFYYILFGFLLIRPVLVFAWQHFHCFLLQTFLSLHTKNFFFCTYSRQKEKTFFVIAVNIWKRFWTLGHLAGAFTHGSLGTCLAHFSIPAGLVLPTLYHCVFLPDSYRASAVPTVNIFPVSSAFSIACHVPWQWLYIWWHDVFLCCSEPSHLLGVPPFIVVVCLSIPIV